MRSKSIWTDGRRPRISTSRRDTGGRRSPSPTCVPLVVAYPLALDEHGTHGHRREVDRDRELGVGRLVGQTERHVEVTRREERTLQVLAFLLRSREVAVRELAPELDDRTVGPVLGQLERRGHRDRDLVLVLEPDADALRVPFVVRLIDLHAVGAVAGIDRRGDGKEILGKGMAQVERCQQRDGVVTARHLHPALVVRGQRTVQSGTDLQVVALLADCGARGASP